MFGISTDPSSESAKFAAGYHIGFPLLADVDGAVSRAYVGVNYDDTTIPGIAIIRRDGTLAYRQVADTKYDRLTAPQLFAEIDRALGTSGAAAETSYAAFERWQLHVDAGGGVRDRGGASGAAAGDLALLAPVSRQLLLGGWIATDFAHVLDLDVSATVRVPLIHDAGAIHITGTTGWSPYGAAPWNAGVRVGPWVAITPRWALHLDLGGSLHGLAQRDAFATIGFSSLIDTGPR